MTREFRDVKLFTGFTFTAPPLHVKDGFTPPPLKFQIFVPAIDIFQVGFDNIFMSCHYDIININTIFVVKSGSLILNDIFIANFSFFSLQFFLLRTCMVLTTNEGHQLNLL